MHLARLPLLCLLIWSACTPLAPTPEAPPTVIVTGDLGQKLAQQLDPLVRAIRSDHYCPSSIAIGVTRGDSIIYAKAFGYANVDTRDTADIYTIYHLASLSKPVVAAALLHLQSQGRLGLDDPVVQYLPYFKLGTAGYERLTIRQILTHTSGLPANVGKDEWEHPTYTADALETYVKGLAETELEFAPGTAYGYSNAGFNVLGDVIAKASGQSFEAYVDQHILQAAGMTTATFLKPDSLPEHWAAPHIIGTQTRVWEHYPYNRMYAPSSALHANIVDLCRWGMLNLGHGSSGAFSVLDSADYAPMVQPWADTPWGEKIGLSWYLQHYEGKPTILHTGADIGFSTQMILYPGEDIGIVVLANRAYSRTARLANAIMEIIADLGVKPYEVSGRFPFCQTWEEQGWESAQAAWRLLLRDTTDQYYANEWELNSIGHGLIFTEEYEKAKTVFAFNIELFPESANTYDSYGDALLAAGDTIGAIGYFQRALEVDPDFGDPGPKLAALAR
ncbi:MAG: serine hydrolase [Bacteroidota bacterium]